MSIKLRRLHQAGDTMVEVLISMAIVSMILGGAYVTSNKSLLATRDAQEHVQALKLADAQLELLGAQPPSAPILNSAAFCYAQVISATPPPTFIYVAQAVINSNCTFTTDGTLAPVGFQPAYSVAITHDANTPPLYKVQITWDSVTGNVNKANVTMFYRTGK